MLRLTGLSLAGAGGYISGSSFSQGNSSNVALQGVSDSYATAFINQLEEAGGKAKLCSSV